MPTETALALVVRGTDWSETSRIVTLFTREFGKVRALAKGGRRLKSSFEVALDLLTVCRVAFIRKAHGGLDLLTEAMVAERFPRLPLDMKSLYTGYYAAELLADGTQDYDPHPTLFDSALALLRLPDATPGAVSAFELVWLRELGYTPRLETCAGCGECVPEAARIGYSPQAGGVLCTNCLPGSVDRRMLSAEARQALRRLTDGDADGLNSAARKEVRSLLAHTVSGVLGRRPKLLGYVDGA